MKIKTEDLLRILCHQQSEITAAAAHFQDGFIPAQKAGQFIGNQAGIVIEIIFMCISRRQPDPKIIFCLVIEFAIVGIAGSVPAKGFLPDCVEVDIGEIKHSGNCLLLLQNQRGHTYPL